MFHNGHIQVIQKFGELNDDIEDAFKFMTFGHLGGARFLGKIIDFEVFGRPLPNKELLQWTLCQNQGKLHFEYFILRTFPKGFQTNSRVRPKF